MADVFVDPQRLGVRAEALGDQRTNINAAVTSLELGCQAVSAACGGPINLGAELGVAARRLDEACSADYRQLSGKVASLSNTIRELARLFAAADQQATDVLNGS